MKPASAATLAAEAAPEIKPDIAPPPATSTPADPLAAARTTTTDAMRATQTNPALQNAPPTTVQVYQRMVERFDGRAQRYEIRLDPANSAYTAQRYAPNRVRVQGKLVGLLRRYN